MTAYSVLASPMAVHAPTIPPRSPRRLPSERKPAGEAERRGDRRARFTAKMHPSKTVSQRFWLRVEKRGEDECWPWKGPTRKGYGFLAVGGTKSSPRGVHRISWELHNGQIPDGLCVCHSCDVCNCCNPKHLWLGTPADNAADRKSKGRSARGNRFPQAKLTEISVKEIRNRLAKGERIATLAMSYRVNRQTIKAVRSGQFWGWVV